jgi:predicted membrane channel-forming protein YqfA (hemolysin III family)
MTESQRSDYPAKVADFLVDLATKIRSLTVDRASLAITWIAFGVVLSAVAFLIVLWVLVALFRALGELLGVEMAYAVVGGILIIVGALLWSRRFPRDAGTEQE